MKKLVSFALCLLLGAAFLLCGCDKQGELRHVTLSTGQLGAALTSLGTAALYQPAFWWAAATLLVGYVPFLSTWLPSLIL